MPFRDGYAETFPGQVIGQPNRAVLVGSIDLGPLCLQPGKGFFGREVETVPVAG